MSNAGEPLLQGVAALVVALSFVLLATRRIGTATKLCAAQAAVVGFGALAARGAPAVGLVEFLEAAALAWGSEILLPLPLRRSERTPPSSPALLVCGAVLAALAASVPVIGLALAAILLGLLLLAFRAWPTRQALGVAALQNGLVLAAVTAGLPAWQLTMVVPPVLPLLAFGALWLGSDRTRTAPLLARQPIAAGIDVAVCGAALLIACLLPWRLGLHGAVWRLDARAALAVLLLCALSVAASWARRQQTPAWGSRLAILAGTVVAVLSSAPLPSWLGMVLATLGTIGAALPLRAEAWWCLRLGILGLGLALFGTIALPLAPAPLAAPAAAMLGYGMVALLAPELTIAAVVLIVRLSAPLADDLLLTLGLAAVLVAAFGLAAPGGRTRHTLPLVGLAQGGMAVFAFGLGGTDGTLSGLLQLGFLALTQCAVLLARSDGLDRLAAVAGLAGVPPAGMFPSLALILAATAAHAPWLLLPLGGGLAAVAWPILRRLPAGRRIRLSPAWVPLALLVVAGFAMPHAVLAWLRIAAQ